MINELVEYSTYIRKIDNPEIEKHLLGKPKLGLHLEVIFNDIDSLEKIQLESFIKEIKFGFYSKKGCDSEKEKWFSSILSLELESEYISNNKAVGGEKNIFSNNPFVIETKIGLDKSKKDFEIEDLPKIFKNKKGNLEKYYNALKSSYSEKILENIYDKILSLINTNFVNNDFWKNYINPNDLKEKFQQYPVDLEKDRLFVIFRFRKIEKDNFEKLFDQAVNNYISEKIFNKDDYNFIINDTLYGLSDFLNGDNNKKPFLKHLSTPFLVNNRIPLEVAKELLKFSKFIEKKVLPNPLPIFIDEKELNEKVIGIFKEESTIKFKELIKKLYEQHKKDLGNYYLIYFEQGDVRDIDYVSNFKYKLENFCIKNFDNIFSNSDEREIPISDIFQLEFYILRMFFSESYINKSDVNLYFSFESKDSAFNSAFMSYKPMLYNFIYKSKQEWMQAYQWKKIFESAFFYHLRKDKDFKNTYQLKEILKIYFSLNEHFDPNNQNFGGHYMPTKLPELHEKLREIILNKEEKHFDSDELFAFGAGQLIYYLLNQSEAGEKTHQLLEPFLNKHRIFEFKKALEKTFEYYKHNIDFNNHSFNRLAREVFGYETDKDLAELKSFILAGYFANNVIYEKAQ